MNSGEDRIYLHLAITKLQNILFLYLAQQLLKSVKSGEQIFPTE